MTATLYYIHDPMCSWCWAFRPTYEKVYSSLPEGINLQLVLGGLAPDNDEPMPAVMREYIQGQWKKIQQQVKGIQFNYAFWNKCIPRRSTYPACRAVIAARNQGMENEDAMVQAIQHCYYLDARNPSEINTLLNLARDIGINEVQFEEDIGSPDTERMLQREIIFSRELGVNSFPALVLDSGNENYRLAINYGDPESILSAINNIIKS